MVLGAFFMHAQSRALATWPRLRIERIRSLVDRVPSQLPNTGSAAKLQPHPRNPDEDRGFFVVHGQKTDCSNPVTASPGSRMIEKHHWMVTRDRGGVTAVGLLNTRTEH
jgi:hypothetical protein